MPYPVNWDFVLDQLEDEKCILCIGPELYQSGSLSFEANLRSVIARGQQDTPELRMYDDGLFYFPDLAQKTLSIPLLKQFYRGEFPETELLLEKIARIPFHLIITLLPDNKAGTAFEKQQLGYRKGFYFKKNPAPAIPRPTKGMPVVYNILGNIEKQDSLVLTHDDLFDYLESVFQQKSMPETLKNEIREARSFILLGLPFDRWYMHLLLRLLSLHTNTSLVKYANGLGGNEQVASICSEQFHINFVGTGFSEFVDTLEQKCAEKNILRKPGARPSGSMLDEMRQLVAADELEDSLEKLEVFLAEQGSEGEEWLDDVIHLSSRFRRLKKKQIHGILSNDEANRERNTLRADLLGLIKQVKILNG